MPIILTLLLAVAAVIAVIVAAWWLAIQITQEESWQAICFIIIAFVLMCIAFSVLYYLMLTDPILKSVREGI